MIKFYVLRSSFVYATIALLSICSSTYAQVEVAPFECYDFNSIEEMNAAAAEDNSDMPFATWKAAYEYAVDNNITTINFASGTYYPGGASGLSSDWGDASGGFPLNVPGMTVNGNGAVIDNSANANNIAFTTLAANNVTLDGFTFIQLTAVNGGAVVVNSGISGWTISNCNFDHCDWAGDGLLVDLSGGTEGTIESCNFYNHIQSTGSAMTITGTGGNLDINNSTYSCNSRIVAGGALRIINASNVDFNGCTFDGNETNSAGGGAVHIEGNSVVTMTNTDFICNTAIVNTQDDGGAIDITNGSLMLEGCNFSGNEAQDKGGAIHVSGASASNLVTLDISNTDFYGNEALTATSYGGAIWMDGFSNTSNISNSYFEGNESVGGNTNGGGGGLYLAGGTGPGELSFNSNTFTGNISGNGVGNAIRTEINFSGTGNSIGGDIFTQCTSPGPGFYNFEGDDFSIPGNWTGLTGTTVSYPSGRLSIDASDDGAAWRDISGVGSLNLDCAYIPTFNLNSEIITWTFTASNGSSLEGFDGTSEDGMAFVIGATSSDFFDANTTGYAVIFDRNNGGQIELTHFSGGLTMDANHTPIASGTGISSGGSSASVRVTYDPSNDDWTLEYDYNTNSNSDLDTDPRGNNGFCMGPAEVMAFGNDDTYTSINLNFTGFAMSGSSAMLVDFYHTRLGDGCTNNAPGSGSGEIQCVSCLSTPAPIDPCMDQGSISGLLWDDGDATSADGQEDANYIEGATVSLYTAEGTLVATVITDANGEYYFGGLEDGDYYVQFTMPAGYLDVTYSNTGASETDNDVDETTLQSHVVTIETSADPTANVGSVDSTDGTSGAANYTNIDAGFSTSILLPIELVDFTVNEKDCSLELKWKTANEINNKEFEIQRSINGINFEKIAAVKGAGTSYSMNSYTFTDNKVDINVNYYYRLKQIDLDGRFDHSGIIHQRVNCDTYKNRYTIYPTVITDISNLVNIVSNTSSASTDILISNINGEVVKAYYNVALSTDEKRSLELENLSPGMYIISIKSANEVLLSQRIIKL